MEVVRPTSFERPKIVRRSDRQRSRITNGSALLPGIDGRSAWVRRAKDIIEEHLADLGGEDNCSAAEQSMVRRIATLTVQLEAMEARFASRFNNSTPISADDLDCYQRTASCLKRLYEAIGWKRRAKNITPSVESYLDQRRRHQHVEVADAAE
jgi:hypothetical protein